MCNPLTIHKVIADEQRQGRARGLKTFDVNTRRDHTVSAVVLKPEKPLRLRRFVVRFKVSGYAE